MTKKPEDLRLSQVTVFIVMAGGAGAALDPAKWILRTDAGVVLVVSYDFLLYMAFVESDW